LLCPACQDRSYAFEKARSLARYEGAAVRAILLLKFEQIEPLEAWFVERLAGPANAGSLFVAFLPHVQAAKLTIYASYC
jgi:predicted amidophosphoribosyltransferase